MKLAPFLVDTYRQYKKSTAIFVNWLASTARATGTVDNIFNPTSKVIDQPTGRKKGRNRSKAIRSQPQKYEVPFTSFTNLARAIVNASRKVPYLTCLILDDIIKARKECAEWYRLHQDESQKEQEAHNDAHMHFITILQEVREILKPLMEARKTNGMSASSKDDEKQELPNMFECLDLEDYADEDLTEGTRPNPAKRKVVDTYELQTPGDDVSFAIYCFLKDLMEIRLFVRQTWREYKHYQIPLTTAATTMNTAIDVFRRLNEEFLESHPQFETHGDIMDFVITEDFPSHEEAGLHHPLMSFLCEDTADLLKGFFSIHAEEVPWFAPPVEVEIVIPGEGKTLLKCLSLIGLLDAFFGKITDQRADINPVHADQMLRAVSTMRKDRKVYTWTLFAVQLFVDTQHELGLEVARGLADLRKDGKWILQVLGEGLEMSKSNKVNHWYRLNHTHVQSLMYSLMASVRADPIIALIEDRFSKKEAEQYKAWGSCLLFENHPMLCGILLQSFLTRLQGIGTGMAAEQGLIIWVMHLMHAGHLASLIPKSTCWSDLDYIIRRQGEAFIFVGGRPTKLFDCFRRLAITNGVSPSIFSLDKNWNPNSRKIKQLESGIELADADMRRTRFLQRRFQPMSRYVQLYTHLDGTKVKLSRAADEPGAMLEQIVQKILDSEKKPGTEKRADRKLSPVESMKVFKNALKEDEFALRFDMMTLNHRCLELLRRIEYICVTRSPLEYPPHEYGHDKNLIDVCCHMLAGVAGVPSMQSTRFREACQEISALIASEGNSEYLKAESRVGIIRTTAANLKDDPEIFNSPPMNRVPFPTERKGFMVM